MARSKRPREIDESPRSQRQRIEPLNELRTFFVTNMEPIRLDVCWSKKRQADFKLADIFAFIRWSHNLVDIDQDLLREYLVNYNPADGSSRVRNIVIWVRAGLLNKVMYLPGFSRFTMKNTIAACRECQDHLLLLETLGIS